MSTPTRERAEQLANMVEKRRQAIESMLMDIKEQRGEDAQLEPGEQGVARWRCWPPNCGRGRRPRPSDTRDHWVKTDKQR